jgi:hypothetical protein
MESTKPKRRRLAISVKMLMLLVLPVAAWLGWVTSKARRQQEAVEAIRRHGGQVFWGQVLYDSQSLGTDAGLPIDDNPKAPKWLQRLVGEEYFREIGAVHFLGVPSTDDGVLRHLRGMNGLRMLTLDGGLATDANLEQVGALTTLEILEISDATDLHAAGVAHLAKLVNLKSLTIRSDSLTEAGLGSLEGLTKLEDLEFSVNSVSDEGLLHLRHLKNLKRLNLGEGCTGITDEGLALLRPLSNLEWLYLKNSPITDRGLEHFKSMPKLKGGCLFETQITKGGMERLEAAVPGLSFSLH